MKNYTVEALTKAINKDKSRGLRGMGHINIETDKAYYWEFDNEFTDDWMLFYPSIYTSKKTFTLVETAIDVKFEFNSIEEVSEWLTKTYC
ncbi:MAG: hypothetical protein IKW37_01185 [Bacteroidaceae bacterium]|nr:hypothetical protein [Bacteroidaceae bacterium]